MLEETAGDRLGACAYNQALSFLGRASLSGISGDKECQQVLMGLLFAAEIGD